MAFWGGEVKPGIPFVLRVSDAAKRLHISQATLGLTGLEYKSVLRCSVGDSSPIFLCSLSPDYVESCQLNLEFQECEKVVFSVIGGRSIHLSGYYLESNQNFAVNDDKSETIGENIEYTDMKGSDSENEYDYADSFINDGDPRANCDSPATASDFKSPLWGRSNKTCRRPVKKYQATKANDTKDWRLGVFSGSDDSLEVPDSEDENVVQQSLSPYAALSLRRETGLKPKRILGGAARGSRRIVCKRVRKSSGVTMLSPDQNYHETGLRKRRNEEQEGTAGVVSAAVGTDGPQILHGNTHNEKQSPEKGNKSLGNVVTSSDQIVRETVLKKKKTTEFQAGSLEVIFGAEEKQAADKEFKSSSSIPPSSHQEFCKELLRGPKKEEVEDGWFQSKYGSEVGKAKISEYDVKLSVAKIINKNIEEQAQADEKTCKKRLEFQNKSDRKQDGPLVSVERNIALKVGEKNGAVTNDTSLILETPPDVLVIEELQKGNSEGKRAETGSTVSVYYTTISKESGQVFRSNVGKELLRFRIGEDSVIDSAKRIKVTDKVQLGIIGMRAGDKRRITIPPSRCEGSNGGSESVSSRLRSRSRWMFCDVEMVEVR